MTWTSFHSRGEVLRNVAALADQRRDGLVPLDVPGATESFDDELDLIAALSLRWHARLSGNMERALSNQPRDLAGAVTAAWRATAADMPGVRAIIDRYTAFPVDTAMSAALTRAQEKEWARLARLAGLANDESRAAQRIGRDLEQQARTGLSPVEAAEVTEAAEAPEATQTREQTVVEDVPASPSTSQVSFVDRIKAVIAA